MFRLIFLLSAVIGFSRDYIFLSDDIAALVFTVFCIDLLADIVVKPFYLRALKGSPNHNIYFHTKLVWMTLAITMLMGGALAAISFLYQGEIIAHDLMFAIPFLAIFRFLSFDHFVRQRFYIFYTLDAAKAILWLLYFWCRSGELLYGGLVLLVAVQFLLSRTLNAEEISTGLSPGRALRTISGHWRNDFFIQVQALIIATVNILDKLLIDDSGREILLYLLIQKFVIFSAGLFGGVILQVWQVRSGNSRHASLSRLFADNCPFIFGIILAFCALFFYVVWKLPVAANLTYDQDVILLGALLLSLTLLRDGIIRWEYIRGRIGKVGIVLSASFIWYPFIIWIFPETHSPVIALALICFANMIAISFIALPIYKEKKLLDRQIGRQF